MRVTGPDLKTPQIESFGQDEVIASGPPTSRAHPPSVIGVKRRPATEITTATARRQASQGSLTESLRHRWPA